MLSKLVLFTARVCNQALAKTVGKFQIFWELIAHLQKREKKNFTVMQTYF